MNLKNVFIKFLKKWLPKHGYDGLVNPGACSCLNKDLAPCEESGHGVGWGCMPGHLVPDPKENSCGELTWRVSQFDHSRVFIAPGPRENFCSCRLCKEPSAKIKELEQHLRTWKWIADQSDRQAKEYFYLWQKAAKDLADLKDRGIVPRGT